MVWLVLTMAIHGEGGEDVMNSNQGRAAHRARAFRRTMVVSEARGLEVRVQGVRDPWIV